GKIITEESTDHLFCLNIALTLFLTLVESMQEPFTNRKVVVGATSTIRFDLGIRFKWTSFHYFTSLIGTHINLTTGALPFLALAIRAAAFLWKGVNAC